MPTPAGLPITPLPSRARSHRYRQRRRRLRFRVAVLRPQSGIDEDAVTGSVYCCLGPYWQAKLGRDELRAYQASARGGEVGVRVAGDRVYLLGEAVTLMRGEIL